MISSTLLRKKPPKQAALQSKNRCFERRYALASIHVHSRLVTAHST
jgi:hypothetical protein